MNFESCHGSWIKEYHKAKIPIGDQDKFGTLTGNREPIVAGASFHGSPSPWNEGASSPREAPTSEQRFGDNLEPNVLVPVLDPSRAERGRGDSLSLALASSRALLSVDGVSYLSEMIEVCRAPLKVPIEERGP